MQIGHRLRELRLAKDLSQGDIEKRTGLTRAYTSNVETGHTVPSIENRARYAAALEIPLYRFFYEGDEPPEKLDIPSAKWGRREWGVKAAEQRELRRFFKTLDHSSDGTERSFFGWLKRWPNARTRAKRGALDDISCNLKGFSL